LKQVLQLIKIVQTQHTRTFSVQQVSDDSRIIHTDYFPKIVVELYFGYPILCTQ